MQTAVSLNGITLNHKDGLIYVDNFNETLDSGVIVCESIDKLEINPMDELVILIEGVNRKFLVSDYVEQIASYNPLKYNYQIQYVSPVLKLERITLPNISITKVYKKTNNENYLIKENDYYVRSVGYYIRQYLEEYYPYDDLVFADDYLIEKADNTKCPEMQFNRPNLRELLQGLFDVLDEILTIKFSISAKKYVLTSLSPNIKGYPIDTSKLDNDVVQNNVITYASNLDIELANAIPRKPATTSQLTIVKSDTGILTTENAKIILDNPIYNIRKVEVYIGYIPDYINQEETPGLNVAYKPAGIDWLDITKFIVEQSIYEGLENNYTDWNVLTKWNTLYFKQGGNTIEGLGGTYKETLFNHSILFTIFKDTLRGLWKEQGIIDEEIYTNTLYGMQVAAEDNFFRLFYKIEYETLQDTKLITERTNPLKHSSTLFDNQEYKYIDVDNFSKNSLSKLNRMSNNERTITAIYTDYTELPELGDYIDDYILTNREISFYDDYIVFKGILTKDFANVYQFNAINSKKRYYNISSGSEALVRHESLKYYFVFDYKQNTLSEYKDFANKIMYNFIRGLEAPKYALMQIETLEGNSNSEKANYSIARAITSFKAGNSTLFTFGFDNNIIAGNYIGSSITGGYAMQPATYTDDYGEFVKVNVELYESENSSFITEELDEAIYETIAKIYPYISLTSIAMGLYYNKLFSFTDTKHKDQREILKWTLQMILCSNNNNIIIGKIMERNNLFIKDHNNIGGLHSCKVYQANYTFNYTNNDVIDTNKANQLEEHATITDDYITINANGNIAIVDWDGNILLAINNYVANTPIYLNVRKVR